MSCPANHQQWIDCMVAQSLILNLSLLLIGWMQRLSGELQRGVSRPGPVAQALQWGWITQAFRDTFPHPNTLLKTYQTKKNPDMLFHWIQFQKHMSVWYATAFKMYINTLYLFFFCLWTASQHFSLNLCPFSMLCWVHITLSPCERGIYTITHFTSSSATEKQWSFHNCYWTCCQYSVRISMLFSPRVVWKRLQ